MNWLERIIEWGKAPMDPLEGVFLALAFALVLLWYSRLNLPNWSLSD